MTEETRTLAGRPIVGSVTGSEPTVEQWDGARFIAALDELLSTPGVSAVRWTQYSPYFNDGEPCEFSVNEFMVRLDESEETPARSTVHDEDEDSGEFVDSWDLDYYGEKPVSPERAAIVAALNTMNGVTAHFESVCREHFGNHAQVTATREGFSVEDYEHD